MTSEKPEVAVPRQTLFEPLQPLRRDPAMLEAVMEALPETSMSRLYLTRGSRASFNITNINLRTRENKE